MRADLSGKARAKAGVPELHLHDLRRSGIRNLIRSGVSQSVAMSISGHRTVSTFNRYDITDLRDQREAFRALERGKNTGSRGGDGG